MQVGISNPFYEEEKSVNHKPAIRTMLSSLSDDHKINLKGAIINIGGEKCTQVGFDYRPQGSHSWKSWVKEGFFDSSDFSYTLPYSSYNDKYEFRAKAYNSFGWGMGSILSTNNTEILNYDNYLGITNYSIANTVILPIPFIHQEETYSCEAAATRQAITFLGRPCSEWDIMARTGRVPPGGDPNQNFVEGYGVHPGPVTRAVNGMNSNYRFGLIAWEWRGSINDLYTRCAAGGVTVIWINQRFGAGWHEHAVTIMGFRNDNIVYMDPYFGGIEEPVWTFMNKWWGWGVAIEHYTWQFVGQSADKDLTALKPGEEFNVTMVAKNVGSFNWYRGGARPVHVATIVPHDRISSFADSSWLGGNRPAGIPIGTDVVAPGQTVSFKWKMKAPNSYGIYNEHFSLVAEGYSWMNNPGVSYYISIMPYSWRFISQTADKDLSKLRPGEEANLTLTAKNTGNMTWTKIGANPVRVGTTNPRDRMSAFVNGWLGLNRPVSLPDGTTSVAPGETVTFAWKIKAPNFYGTWREGFSLLAEGKAWMNDPGINYYINVRAPYYSWQFISQAASRSLVGLSPGEQVTISLTAKNTGNTIWYRTGSNPVRVGTTNPRDRASVFANGSWLNAGRPVGLPVGTDSVAPGATVTFTWTYTAPARAGTYREGFSLLAEGKAWMNDPGANYYTVVH